MAQLGPLNSAGAALFGAPLYSAGLVPLQTLYSAFLTAPPSECGQTHTNSRHTHLPLPHNSSSIPLQSMRTGETYTMPYAAGELCLQHNHTFIRLVVGYNLYFILVISRMVRLPALLRVLRTLNSAPSRTIQARTIEGTPLYIYLHIILYFLCAISKGPYDCTDR